MVKILLCLLANLQNQRLLQNEPPTKQKGFLKQNRKEGKGEGRNKNERSMILKTKKHLSIFTIQTMILP